MIKVFEQEYITSDDIKSHFVDQMVEAIDDEKSIKVVDGPSILYAFIKGELDTSTMGKCHGNLYAFDTLHDILYIQYAVELDLLFEYLEINAYDYEFNLTWIPRVDLFKLYREQIENGREHRNDFEKIMKAYKKGLNYNE